MVEFDRLQSKVIDYLRFPMIVAVVFLHSSMTDVSYSTVSVDEAVRWQFPVFHLLVGYISNVIARVAVPLFFFISGYLFYYKVEDFNKGTYLQKLRRRVKNLLIPYLIWNLMLFACYYAAVRVSFGEGAVSVGEEQFQFEWPLIWRFFLVVEDPAFPHTLNYQFWFVRDLIVCVIISPLLYYVASHWKGLAVVVLGVLWMTGYSIPVVGHCGFSMVALFFFTGGGWFSIHKRNVVGLSADLKWLLVAYPVWTVLDFISQGAAGHLFIHNIGILLGILFWFILIARLIQKNQIRPVPFLAEVSFFLFAIHEPWLLSQFRKLFFGIISPNSDLEYCLIYLMSVTVTVVLAMVIYKILSKLTPSILSILTGQRTRIPA